MKPSGIFRDTGFTQNIVLIQLIGLCPIILSGISLKYGVVLTVCTMLVQVNISLLMSVLGGRIPDWLQPPVCAIVSAGLLLGAGYVIGQYISPELYAGLDIFVPLIAVSTLVTYRAGGFAAHNHPGAALADALGASLGFGVVICIVAALREIVTFGTLWDVPIGFEPIFARGALPFVGFILLAYMAAVLQKILMVSRMIREPRPDSRDGDSTNRDFFAEIEHIGDIENDEDIADPDKIPGSGDPARS